jgi:hypothetical protein
MGTFTRWKMLIEYLVGMCLGTKNENGLLINIDLVVGLVAVVLRGYDYNCVFGKFYFEDLTNGIKLMKMLEKGRDHIKYFKRGKCGIEVLGMKPQRTKDGKYSWKGLIITELKTACKNNGIKKFSKMDKCELVKALLKC